jgi:hypothetical protein
VLGLFPRGRLFPQTVRGRAGRWRRSLITARRIYFIFYISVVVPPPPPVACRNHSSRYAENIIILCCVFKDARPFALLLSSVVTSVHVSYISTISCTCVDRFLGRATPPISLE